MRVEPVRAPTLEEVREAAERQRCVVARTPLVPFAGSLESGLLLKPETLQPEGSFKIRGIYNAVASMSEEERARGLSTVSAGNTARALAWCGRHFGVPARSLMPIGAPQAKIDAIEALGAEAVLVEVPDLFRFLQERSWEDEPYSFVHPWIDRRVLVGHASMALEIAEDAPRLESVFIPVGGGGLIGGVAGALKLLLPEVKVVAVEPEGCPALHASLEAGAPASVDCTTSCDGVAVPYVTDEMYPLLADIVDEVVLVSEEAVADNIRRLALQERIVSEPSGALALAAALSVPKEKRGLSVALVTGGSIGADKLVSYLRAEG